MVKTKIKEDSHGFYVRANGWLFRPQFSTMSFPYHKKDHIGWVEVETQVEQEVKVKLVRGTPMLRVYYNKTDYDLWYFHGMYLGYNFDTKKNFFVKSDELWSPKELT